MTITRKFFGGEVTITLTDKELNTAYLERQKAFDRVDLEVVAETLEDHELSDFGVTLEELLTRLDDLAEDYRDKMDLLHSERIDFNAVAFETMEEFFCGKKGEQK